MYASHFYKCGRDQNLYINHYFCNDATDINLFEFILQHHLKLNAYYVPTTRNQMKPNKQIVLRYVCTFHIFHNYVFRLR